MTWTSFKAAPRTSLIQRGWVKYGRHILAECIHLSLSPLLYVSPHLLPLCNLALYSLCDRMLHSLFCLSTSSVPVPIRGRWERERGREGGMNGSYLTTKSWIAKGFFSIRPVCGPRSQYSFSLMYSWAWNFNVICGGIQMASSRIDATRWQRQCQRPSAQ